MVYISAAELLAKRLGNRRPPRWQSAVISFRDRKGSDGLMRALRAEPILDNIFYGQEAFAESPFVFEANVQGEKVGLITRCIWGGPQAAILIEELACLGVKYLIGYGSAGAIDSSLQLGEQVVASSAIASDGTSKAYAQSELIEADADLMRLVLESARKFRCEIIPVRAITVDTFYRETKDLVSIWRRQGAQIVNFDVSPFYAVSKVYNIKSIWISHVSDRLVGKWENWFWDRDKTTRLSEMICTELCSLIRALPQ
jgi:uridine phosphorylase